MFMRILKSVVILALSIILIKSLVILAFAIALSHPVRPLTVSVNHEKGIDYFEFELSPEEVERLEKGLTQLKLGDSVQRAKSILGKPSDEGELYRKHVVGRGTFVNRYLRYNVKLMRIGIMSLNDHVIALYFDSGGALVEAERLGYSRSGEPTDPSSFQIVEKIL